MIDKGNFIMYLKKKNTKALDYVIDTYSNIIFKVAYGVLKNRELSEECLNDVLLKIWNNMHHFNKMEDEFYLWIIAIAKYTAIDILRKEHKHTKLVSICDERLHENQCLISKIISKEKLRKVKNEINSMNDIDKEIFMRKFYLDESNRDIAKCMGLTENYVNLRIFRGRKKLKVKLWGDKI